MNPAEFISFAGKVVSMGAGGARSAISRSCYGVFHFSRTVLEDLGFRSVRNGTSHNILVNYFQTATHADAQTAGGLPSNLHSYRVKADYDLHDVDSESMAFAQNCVIQAVTIQQLLTSYRQACLADHEILQDLQRAIARVDAVRRRV
jgi:hypothetical protein